MSELIKNLKKRFPYQDEKEHYHYVGSAANVIVKFSFVAAMVTNDFKEHRKSFKDGEEIPIIRFDDKFLWIKVFSINEIRVNPDRFKGFKIVSKL